MLCHLLTGPLQLLLCTSPSGLSTTSLPTDARCLVVMLAVQQEPINVYWIFSSVCTVHSQFYYHMTKIKFKSGEDFKVAYLILTCIMFNLILTISQTTYLHSQAKHKRVLKHRAIFHSFHYIATLWILAACTGFSPLVLFKLILNA